MSFAMGMTLLLAALALFLVIYGLAGKAKAIWGLGLCFLAVAALIFLAVAGGEGLEVLLGGIAL